LGKRLISKIYKKLKKLNIKNPNNPVNKRASELDSSQKERYKWSINT
jgi:hypothetical protein